MMTNVIYTGIANIGTPCNFSVEKHAYENFRHTLNMLNYTFL